MSQSLLNPMACGCFIKAFLFTMADNNYDETIQAYEEHLTSSTKHMIISRNEIVCRTKTIKKLILKLGKTSPIKKALYLHWFSLHEWKKLTEKEKKGHSPFHCYGCIKSHYSYLTLLPTSRQSMNTCENHKIKITLPNIKPGTL